MVATPGVGRDGRERRQSRSPRAVRGRRGGARGDRVQCEGGGARRSNGSKDDVVRGYVHRPREPSRRWPRVRRWPNGPTVGHLLHTSQLPWIESLAPQTGGKMANIRPVPPL